MTTDDSRAFFAKYPQKPDQVPIKYFTRLPAADLRPVHFFDVHGPELDLYCQNKVVFRKSEWNDSSNCFECLDRLDVQRLVRPYVFIDLPMTPDDELYIRILSIDPTYRTS